MLYSFFCYDHPNSLKSRIKARPAHIARLHTLQAENRLIIAGPNPAIDDETPGDAGFTGSLIIARFNSLQEAQAWADAEPYLKAGVYSHVDVKPFKKVLPS
ncbi:BolA family transcriptional regulator [Piscirickettsia salmonis]|uniref:YciI-like protein n=1 Tax=Piscirickettsia salmonis TaxID=1238 RepID=A0A9Q5VF63_PISSA|nr:YciI family protein [Piscirickettsia salmonis]RNC78419.1 hypothetical protein DA717_04735 [Piscirickettsiaceae bacterium NZ-RLO2]ALA25996.1 BolA family transcriptional regulator [Piscirickettsia salmonis]APS43457.1 BolA family transcriptional regulator [Piscirickettsia salmonis]APS46809.1 BolA family transcriptional regulator [Piscirickettsia salmonis]APS50782.1 BolA family transcriptional regulator [Piscirickettsia salmonis]